MFIVEHDVSILFKVSILTTNMIRKRKSFVKHIEYEVSINEGEMDALMGKYSSGSEKAGFRSYLPYFRLMMNGLVKACQALVSNNETLSEIKNADLIVSFSLFCCGSYIAEIFDKPIVLVHPGTIAPIGPYAQVPLPPSYVPRIASVTDEMAFVSRTMNFVVTIILNIAVDTLVTHYFKAFQKEMGSTSTQSFSQLFGKAELYIIASVDFAFEYVHPVMPSRFLTSEIHRSLANSYNLREGCLSGNTFALTSFFKISRSKR